MNLGPYIIIYGVALLFITIAAFISSAADDEEEAHYDGMHKPAPKLLTQMFYTIIGICVFVAGFLHTLNAMYPALKSNLPITW